MIKNIFKERVKILANQKIGKDFFELMLESSDITKKALPGQFIEIKVSDAAEPLLRRPLGIHSVKGRNFKVLVEIKGQATKILSTRKVGEYLDVIGPLGNGFFLQPETCNLQPILIAGGMGVAPLLFLAEKIVSSVKFQVSGKPIILIGARTKNQILCEKEFKSLGCKVEIATDDGSKGFKGIATDLLVSFLETCNLKPATIFGCGPAPMLKALSGVAGDHRIPAQLSLEAHMACGIGACLGCVVNTKNGFKRVCKEGPVFDAQEIVWD
ncbi:MAG: dihydroorotate dehydrogenase electron transfer subunit [Candidatus Omnitrophica bacterium]|nr:dihydroorotate dehydrogenase electron transfer subunit [Candidatus Omnitrophota bacterium]